MIIRLMLRRTITAFIAVIAVLGMLTSSRTAAAFDTVTPFSSGKPSPVTEAHYRIQLQSQSYYTQTVAMRAWLDDGAVFNVEFMASNVGRGTHRGGVNAWYRPPEDGGQRLQTRVERSRGQWSHQDSPAGMQVGESFYEGAPGKMKVVISGGDLEAELEFTNILPPWRPGSGRTWFGSDRKDFYDVTILAPKAQVSGRVKVDGEWKNVNGYGFADNKITTVAPHHQARTWVRFRAYEGDWTIMTQEFILPANRGGIRVPWLFIGYKDRLVFQSTTHSLIPADMQSHSRSGYQYPMRLDLSSREQDRTLEGKITATKLTSSKNLLEDLGRLERLVVSRFAKPYAFYFDANYRLQLEVGERSYELTGTGEYDVKHINR